MNRQRRDAPPDFSASNPSINRNITSPQGNIMTNSMRSPVSGEPSTSSRNSGSPPNERLERIEQGISSLKTSREDFERRICQTIETIPNQMAALVSSVQLLQSNIEAINDRMNQLEMRCSSASSLQSSSQGHQPSPTNPPPTLPAKNVTEQPKHSMIYASTGTLTRGKPPPLPVRRTSAISDPNAITIGTLRSTGCSTYEEVKRKSTIRLDDASYYDDNIQPIYSNSDCCKNGFTSLNSDISDTYPADFDRISKILERHKNSTSISSDAFKDDDDDDISSGKHGSVANISRGSGARLTKMHKSFIRSLNDKLSNPIFRRMSPKVSKKRSMSMGEHEWDSDSGIVSEFAYDTEFAMCSVSSNSRQFPSSNQGMARVSSSTSLSSFSQGHQTPPLMPPQPARNVTEQPKHSMTYASTGTLSRGKPPPLPVRRTSAISDPNAITLGTLKSTGCSTYEEVKRKSTIRLDDNSYFDDSQPIYSNMNSEGSKNSSSVQTTTPVAGTHSTDPDRISAILQKHRTTTSTGISSVGSFLANSDVRGSSTSRCSDTASKGDDTTQPAHTGAAAATTNYISNGSGAKLTNVHKDFIQSLNDKLSIPASQRMSPKLTKKRSMSIGEHEWDSDSGIVTECTSNTNSATSSITSNSHPSQNGLQQSLMRLMSTSTCNSTSSITSSRPSSAISYSQRSATSSYSSDQSQDVSGRTSTASTITSSSIHCDSSSLNPNRQSCQRVVPVVASDPSEIAKAAASIANRRRQNATQAEVNAPQPTGTYSATPARVEYSPTHVPVGISQELQQQCREENNRDPAQPLKTLSPTKNGDTEQKSMEANNCQVPQAKRNSQPVMGVKAASVVIINASRQSQQQHQMHTHHPSLDINIPSDASMHSSAANAIKRGSLPADILKKDIPMSSSRHYSAGNVISEAIGSFESAITSRVNDWLTSASTRAGSVDLTSCRETLMDQIKKGIQLKKVSGSDCEIQSIETSPVV